MPAAKSARAALSAGCLTLQLFSSSCLSFTLSCSLIDREYLERDKNDNNVYTYLA